MSSTKKNVVIGVLGTVLDRRGKKANRWHKWRPSIGLCQQPDLHIDRFELVYQPGDMQTAGRVKEDIEQASPQTDHRTLSERAAGTGRVSEVRHRHAQCRI